MFKILKEEIEQLAVVDLVEDENYLLWADCYEDDGEINYDLKIDIKKQGLPTIYFDDRDGQIISEVGIKFGDVSGSLREGTVCSIEESEDMINNYQSAINFAKKISENKDYREIILRESR